MVFLHLFIVNRSGGLIHHRALSPKAPHIGTNEWLRIGSTFHSLHAIAAEASPIRLKNNRNASGADDGIEEIQVRHLCVHVYYRLRIAKLKHFLLLQAGGMVLRCLQTRTGLKFVITWVDHPGSRLMIAVGKWWESECLVISLIWPLPRAFNSCLLKGWTRYLRSRLRLKRNLCPICWLCTERPLLRIRDANKMRAIHPSCRYFDTQSWQEEIRRPRTKGTWYTQCLCQQFVGRSEWLVYVRESIVSKSTICSRSFFLSVRRCSVSCGVVHSKCYWCLDASQSFSRRPSNMPPWKQLFACVLT